MVGPLDETVSSFQQRHQSEAQRWIAAAASLAKPIRAVSSRRGHCTSGIMVRLRRMRFARDALL